MTDFLTKCSSYTKRALFVLFLIGGMDPMCLFASDKDGSYDGIVFIDNSSPSSSHTSTPVPEEYIDQQSDDKRKIEKLEVEIEEWKKKYDDLKKKYDKILQNNTDLNDTTNILTENKKHLILKNTTSQNYAVNVERTNKQLRERLNDLQEQKKNLVYQVDQLNEFIEQQGKFVTNYAEENERLKKEHERLKKEHERLKDKVGTNVNRSEPTNLKPQKSSELEAVDCEGCKQLRRDNNDLDREVIDLTAELKIFHEGYYKVEKRCNNLLEEYNQLKKLYDDVIKKKDNNDSYSVKRITTYPQNNLSLEGTRRSSVSSMSPLDLDTELGYVKLKEELTTTQDNLMKVRRELDLVEKDRDYLARLLDESNDKLDKEKRKYDDLVKDRDDVKKGGKEASKDKATLFKVGCALAVCYGVGATLYILRGAKKKGRRKRKPVRVEVDQAKEGVVEEPELSKASQKEGYKVSFVLNHP